MLKDIIDIRMPDKPRASLPAHIHMPKRGVVHSRLAAWGSKSDARMWIVICGVWAFGVAVAVVLLVIALRLVGVW